MAEILGFTTEQTSRVTGLSLRQLRYWEKTGFFSPGYSDSSRRTYSAMYSFRDLVGLRTIGLLRNDYQVPLQELRRVGAWLQEKADTPWSSLTFYVSGKSIYFEDPATGAVTATHPRDQQVMPFEMTRLANDTHSAVQRLRRRAATDIGEIRQQRAVAQNQPVVAGTRIATSSIWNLYRAGYSTQAILDEYPRLTEKDVKAALAFEEEHRTVKAG